MCGGVICDGTNLGKDIGAAVFSEFPGVLIQNPVLRVKPHFAFRHITESVPKEVCEYVSGANIVPRLFCEVHRVRFFRSDHTKILGSRRFDDGFVNVVHFRYRLCDSYISVGVGTTMLFPLRHRGI